MRPWARLARRLAELGLRADRPFTDDVLVTEALTHTSFVAEQGGRDNQRLEMLGDAVLGLVVAELLYDLFPTAGEGVLTRLRASLVQEDSLARQARLMEIGPLIRLGRGAELEGGRERDSVLADAFEALLAALYRSEGYETARGLVDKLFRAEAVALQASPQPFDYKTALQERAQAELRGQPNYRIAERSGPAHQPVFVAEAMIGTAVIGRGEGRTKKLAEQQAASMALDDWAAVLSRLRGGA